MKYRGIRDVHELADYLNLSPENLMNNSQILKDFLQDYEERGMQC